MPRTFGVRFGVATCALPVPLLALIAVMGGCATVSVYEPSYAEISLTEEQSDLHKAADAYCKDARARRASPRAKPVLARWPDMLTGKDDDQNAYWRKIGADTFRTCLRSSAAFAPT